MSELDRRRYALWMRTAPAVGVLLILAATTSAAVDREKILAAPAHMAKESGTPLEDVVDHLRDGSQQNVFINWKAVEAAGVKRTMPLTIDLSGLTLGEAATRITKEISGHESPIAFAIDEGVVTISTAEDLAMNIETRTYDVRRFLNPNDAGRKDRLSTLLRRVQGIDPRSWKSNGGKLGSVKELGGQLIVTQTPAVHERIIAEMGFKETP